MPESRPPPGFDEIQQAESARTFGSVVGIRMMVAPIAVAVVVALAWWEPSVWRRVLLSSAGLLLLSVSAVEVVRFRRRGMRPSSLPFNIGLGVYGQLLVSFATGALESPFLPVAAPLAILNGLFVRQLPLRAGFALSQVVSYWCLAALAVWRVIPDLNLASFGGGGRAGHNDVHLWTMAAVMTLVTVVATGLGRGLRSTFDGMLWRALQARDEALKVQQENARDLTALSGEIAHELKNPMASVKGLAALLAQGAPEGKSAERLGVLRREVDRMQGILDEFLNYSRPLVPLALAPVDLGALCREVAALHEGLARERGVHVTVAGAHAVAHCDPRKVKQVLINLVQNALDVSQAGGIVELEVAAGAGRVQVRVLDRGPGLDPSLAGRAFEPGVTTKPRGSGLGLTIARALARQHAGELTLAERPGGGCVAELDLPETAPAAQAGASAS